MRHPANGGGSRFQREFTQWVIAYP
jgi:hypothetical protein